MPCLQHRKTRAQVHVLHALPRLQRRVEHGDVVVGRDAGVVEQHVDAARTPRGARAKNSITAASSATSAASARSTPSKSSRRSTPTTVAPSARKSAADAAPIPPAAPVITQTLPSSRLHARAASTSAAISARAGRPPDATGRRARTGASGPRSPPPGRPPSPSPSPRSRPRSRPRPDGDAISSDASARPRPARRASPRPAARRGRRRRPGRARWSSWPSTSGRCSISVPPRARFISCMPRQTPSSGRSRSIAASAERDLERVAVGRLAVVGAAGEDQPVQQREDSSGSARRAGAGRASPPARCTASRTTRGSSTASSSHTLQRARSTAAQRPMTGRFTRPRRPRRTRPCAPGP